MAGVRAVVRALSRDHELDQWSRDEAVELSLTFLAQPCAEDKLAGILLLAEHLLPTLGADDIDTLARPFERDDITEWSTCDWYAVKVLARLLQRAEDSRAAAEALASWRTADSLWQRRAAAVAFILVAPHARKLALIPDLILEVCAANARDPARFSQTSVGWVLRELSKAEPALVAAFVEKHLDLLSREARYMATERLEPEVRGRFNPSRARR